MDRDEIREKVCAAVENSGSACAGGTIRDDHYLKDDLGMDSLDIVEMVMSLERDLSIYVSDSETSAIEDMTVGELVDFLDKTVNG